ncbi:MAG: bifunctional DNA primase/polymerase [Isosphaeraceae bacterium]
MDEAYARDGLVHELIEDFDLYSELGWRAVPVRGKKAMLKWKPAPARSAVRRTLESGNATGLAIILGASGLVVRDFDEIEAYRRWAELHPALAGELPDGPDAAAGGSRLLPVPRRDPHQGVR